ncbi:MAG: hypothetical protein KDA61_14760, partial [Planctomycetales bacterium]|nr:hypothetical protein [Planctomycetales bacterium]
MNANADSTSQGTPSDRDLGVHEAARREKLQKIIDLGVDPWGGRFDDRMLVGDARALESSIAATTDEAGETSEQGPQVRVAGRVML